MAIFKCKMCGGDLHVESSEGISICEYCDTKQTLSKRNDEKIVNMYNRANHFRRNNEFDKARETYENILNEDSTDSEAYWSILLCKYGIEYVEDPKTKERVITCNRTQLSSILIDENYKVALQYADSDQKLIYEKEARTIDAIQKGILAISNKEKPFDVFICYKETDNRGLRTPDSVLANDIYHRLTDEGFRVFFSRITLEDKVGIAYEPYIFAALNSAKVMIVLGTQKEYFNATWVKNEWSRYLSLIDSGNKKTLIPAYKDMDPYDLPEEFAYLQALDMSNIGFIVDLIRGVKKILSDNVSNGKEITMPSSSKSDNIESLLKRVYILLEDSKFNEAKQYSERILEQEPENARAYICEFMVEYQINKESQIADIKRMECFENNSFVRAMLYADDKYNETLLSYKKNASEKIDIRLKEELYKTAKIHMHNGESGVDLDGYKKACTVMEEISDFKDVHDLMQMCKSKLEEPRYQKALDAFDRNDKDSNKKENYLTIGKLFQEIEGYKNSKAYIEKCEELYYEIYYEEILTLITKAKQAGSYRELCREISKIEFWDGDGQIQSIMKINRSIYELALTLENKDKNFYIENAIKLYQTIPGFQDVAERIKKCQEIMKKNSKRNIKRLLIAISISMAIISICIGIVASINYIKEIENSKKYEMAMQLFNDGEYFQAVELFKSLGSYNDSPQKAKSSLSTGKSVFYEQGKALYVNGMYLEAYKKLVLIGRYKDSAGMIHEILQMLRVELPTGVIDSTDTNGETKLVALKSDGRVLVAGVELAIQQEVEKWQNIKKVSISNSYIFGLKEDGRVVVVGEKADTITEEIESWTDIIMVTSNDQNIIGVKNDGTIVVAGDNSSILATLGGWSDIISIDFNKDSVIGLSTKRTLSTLEFENSAEGNLKNWEDVVLVTASDKHIIALRRDGTMLRLGEDDYGQLNVRNWTDVVTLETGDFHTIGLRYDGTVVATGRNDNGQLNVENWTDVVAVSVGDNYTVGLKSNGTIVVAGTVSWSKDVEVWKDIKVK